MHEIRVGTLGTVHRGSDYDEAYEVWRKYRLECAEPGFAHTLEPITWFDGGSIYAQWSCDSLSGNELAKCHGVLHTSDFAIPSPWFKAACDVAGCNVSGHIVWNYPTALSAGEPFGITPLGRRTIEAMTARASN